MYKISSKVCVLFWGFKISLPELSLPTSQTLRWLLQDGAEECIGHGFVTHRGGHQRFAASLRRLDRRLDVCIAVDLWSSGHHQTGRKLGKWPFFQGDVVVITFLYVFRNFVYFVDLFLMMIYNYNIYIYTYHDGDHSYFSGNCSWFSPYFRMFEPCWAQREAGIGDTRMLYCTHRCT